MKFVKGMIIGSLVVAGVTMMCNEGMMNKRRIMRKGRQIAKKMGVM